MVGRFFRILIAGLILWLLWGARIFWPAQRELPDGTVLVASREDLGTLEVGRSLAIEGRVYPAAATATDRLWKERFAYRLAISRKDEFGGREDVVKKHVRPAVRFAWAGGEFFVSADSYRIESAPDAPGDSLLQTTERNVGFRSGDEALALGSKTDGPGVVVEELALAPLDAYVKKLGRENVLRAWIGHGLRTIVSLFAIALALGAAVRSGTGAS